MKCWEVDRQRRYGRVTGEEGGREVGRGDGGEGKGLGR